VEQHDVVSPFTRPSLLMGMCMLAWRVWERDQEVVESCRMFIVRLHEMIYHMTINPTYQLCLGGLQCVCYGLTLGLAFWEDQINSGSKRSFHTRSASSQRGSICLRICAI